MQAYSVPMTPPPTMIMLFGQPRQAQEAVAVDDALVVEGDVGGAGRRRAGGDDDVLRAQDLAAVGAHDAQRVGSSNAPRPTLWRRRCAPCGRGSLRARCG